MNNTLVIPAGINNNKIPSHNDPAMDANYTQTISLNIQNLSEFNFSMAGACEGQINLGQNESGRGLAGCSNGNSCGIG